MAPLAALLLAASASAAVPNPSKAEAKGVIHLVLLAKGGVPPKAEVAAAAEKANAVFSALGSKARVVVEKAPLEFDPAAIGDQEAVAVVGTAAVIKPYLHKKLKDHFTQFENWNGGDEPERSQNQYMYAHKGVEGRGGGRIVAVDWPAIKTFAGMMKWTAVDSAAFFLVHGAGHNSDLDGQLQHNEYGGVMVEGTILQGYSTQMPFAKITAKAVNPKLVSHLKQRFE